VAIDVADFNDFYAVPYISIFDGHDWPAIAHTLLTPTIPAAYDLRPGYYRLVVGMKIEPFQNLKLPARDSEDEMIGRLNNYRRFAQGHSGGIFGPTSHLNSVVVRYGEVANGLPALIFEEGQIIVLKPAGKKPNFECTENVFEEARGFTVRMPGKQPVKSALRFEFQPTADDESHPANIITNDISFSIGRPSAQKQASRSGLKSWVTNLFL
jgi:hypothetical protein